MEKEAEQTPESPDLSKLDGENLMQKSKGKYKKQVVKTKRKRAAYDPKFIKLVSRLTAAGFKPNDLGFILGVPRNTIDQWKNRYPEFRQAVEHGRTIAGSFVVDKGLKLCDGYEVTEEVVKYENAVERDDFGNATGCTTENWVPVEKKLTKRHIPPSASLIQFFLTKLIPEMFGNAATESKEPTHVREVADGIQQLAGKLTQLAGGLQEPIEADFEEPEDDPDNDSPEPV